MIIKRGYENFSSTQFLIYEMKEVLNKTLREAFDKITDKDIDKMEDKEFMLFLLAKYFQEEKHATSLRRIYKVNKDIACSLAYLLLNPSKD